ncbi:MAG: LysR family transcriptional regulator [Roseburia sp.]
MDINLEYYKIFYYVAKYQSITAAAEMLTISQPAVSQAVKHLEKDLDCALFVRMSKGVRLTKEGELLFSYVERGYETILLGEHKLNEMLNLDAGEIRIGASDMTLQFYLLDYLEQFHEKYPGIKVVVTNAPTPETLKHLKDGKIDFGIVSTPVPEVGKLKWTSVRDIRDIFVAGNNFEMLKGRVLSYHELEKLPIMCLEGNTSTRRYVEDFLVEQGVRLSPEFELATSDMLIQFAVRNLGIASVVEDFARKKIESGELFELTFEQEIPERQFCIVTNEKIPISAAAEKLLHFLYQGETKDL